jgi:hypothetical protein
MQIVSWPIKAPTSGRFTLENVLARPTRLNWTGKEQSYLIVALPEDALRIGVGNALREASEVQNRLAEALDKSFYGDTPVLDIGHPGFVFRLYDGGTPLAEHTVALHRPLYVEHNVANNEWFTDEPAEMARRLLDWVIGPDGATLGHYIEQSAFVEVIPATWMIVSQNAEQQARAALERARLQTAGTGFLELAQVDLFVGKFQAFVDDFVIGPAPAIEPRHLATVNMRPRVAAAPAPASRA